MSDLIEKTLNWLCQELSGGLSRAGDGRYAAATAIWAKPAGPMPRAVAHCGTPEDVQAAIRAAHDSGLSLSVRGGGHDWAGRALCDGLVIDLSGMNTVAVDANNRRARISGGARASDVLATTDPLGLAAVTGSCSGVGMAGLTLGGGYGPLIGRFGLALDNLLGAEVVLADGRIVRTQPDIEEELFWALRGGGGNFGVVTAMRHQLHDLSRVCGGLLLFPFTEARGTLGRCAEITAFAPDELTIQLGFFAGPDGSPVVFVAPTWCGIPNEGEARVAPFLKLGTLLAGGLNAASFGASLAVFDTFNVNGQRTFMETCWLPSLDGHSIDIFIEATAKAVSPGCAIVTHEFKGAASRVPVEATAFGFRRDHVLVEILATHVGHSDKFEEQRHQQWTRATRHAFDAIALPGGYPNLLARSDAERAAESYGPNFARLFKAKRRYDPENVFRSAIPLSAHAAWGNAA